MIFIEFWQVAFGFSVILFWGDLKQSTGYDSGHWFWGTMLYLAVLLTVLGKAALVSECVRSFMRLCYRYSCFPICSIWTKYTVAGTANARDCDRLDADRLRFSSDSGIIRFYHALPSSVHCNCSQYRFLTRVPGIRSPVVHG